MYTASILGNRMCSAKAKQCRLTAECIRRNRLQSNVFGAFACGLLLLLTGAWNITIELIRKMRLMLQSNVLCGKYKQPEFIRRLNILLSEIPGCGVLYRFDCPVLSRVVPISLLFS